MTSARMASANHAFALTFFTASRTHPRRVEFLRRCWRNGFQLSDQAGSLSNAFVPGGN